MTYFLDDAPVKPMAARGPDQMPSTWTEGVGAAFSQMQRDTNANFQRQHEVTAETALTVGSVYERLGEAEILRSLKSKGLIPDLVQALPQDAIRYNRAATEAVLQMGRDAQTANPDVWSGVDLSEEGIQKRVTDMRVAEDRDEQQTLDMLPKGRGSAAFLGGAAGMIADARQLPFLAVGGGSGSVLKVMGREAALNVAAEAVTLPSQYETAKELGKPAPDLLSQLGMAAAGGAVLGGGMHGLGRALEYFKGRSASPRIEPFNEEYSNIIVTAAEDALAKGEDPIAAASRAMDALPVEALPEAAAFRDITSALDEFGPQNGLRVPENDIPFRVPQSATAIPKLAEDPATPVAGIRSAISNAMRYRAAREHDPAAFDAVLDSQKKIASYRSWLAEMVDAQNKEVADLHAAIDGREQSLIDRLNTMQTGGRRVIKGEIAKIRAARQEAMSLAERVETPDMARVRRALLEEDARMREFGPRIAKALAATKDEPVTWLPVAKDVTPVVQWQLPARGLDEPARHLRTSNEPDASVPSRIPDTTGQPKDTPQPSGFQGSQALSDPASPEARPVLDAMTADIRDEIAKGDDFKIDMVSDEGRQLSSASAVLDYLDELDRFSARVDLCGAVRRVD